MNIHDVLLRDPRSAPLVNNGQARIVEVDDNPARTELRAELEMFVCDGRFGEALRRILDRYLTSLGTPRQDSAWVSGFFGSGKSHLLKMLAHLWRNTGFPDGSTARTLVGDRLPDEVHEQFRELDTHARRAGRPAVAAAGTLLSGNVDLVRHSVLRVLLRAQGWPDQYPQARFCFWLRERGLLEGVRAAVEAAGKDWLRELNDLYVSPVIAEALIAADESFASDVRGARQLLTSQFPPLTTDISTEQFVAAARQALTADGELPHTILVLDEVQQYIAEAQDRSSAITELAEAVQTQFDSRVMLVGAGQSALAAGTPVLMWLRDRFRIAIELTDADVEAVTRKVLLRKKASALPAVEAIFQAHGGEIARHLHGTRLGPRAEDALDRVADYPLLSTRRRFWEACFQAVDAAGSHSQLRSQLRILHDSLQKVAERPLGAVISAADLYEALAADLVNKGVLLNEISTRIQKLLDDDGCGDGRLQHDLCGLVFLIGKLPRQEGTDQGVRANAATLADLLIDDVSEDSGAVRHHIAGSLQALADNGTLMKVGDEYRLQTTEGAEWESAFRERRSALSEVDIARRRELLFSQAVDDLLKPIRPVHGEARLRRKLALHVSGEPPASNLDVVHVWLRDGWSCAPQDAASEALRMGADDPTLHVHLPKKSADVLRDRIVDTEAAQRVLDLHGHTVTPEAREARESMESRRAGAAQERDAIVRDLLRAATVLQGGGSELFGEGLSEKINKGVEASLIRLFPRFPEGDHRAWEAAVTRARQGSDQPLKVVGWEGPTDAHPVARGVLDTIGVGAGVRGTAIHKALMAPPCGWPQDAVDAVLIALHRSGHLRVTRNGQPVALDALDQAGVKTAEFRPEKVRLTTSQRIALRGLFDKLDVRTKGGEEEAHAPLFLAALDALRERAGGAAPLPAAPEAAPLDDLKRLAGNEQLAALHDQRQRVEQWIADWSALADRAAARMPMWSRADALLRHAAGLPVADEARGELEAIQKQRSLLADIDPAGPLVSRLAAALREALLARHAELAAAVSAACATLAGDATWARLTDDARQRILNNVRLVKPSPLEVATDDALLRALNARSLEAWRSEIDAVDARTVQALQAAAAELTEDAPPATAVHVRRGVLADEAAVREWLTEQEEKLLEAARNGPVIVR